MISNDKIFKCACKVRGLAHVFITDASGLHILIADPDSVHILQTVGWTVAPIHKRSQRLHARATHGTPGIRKGKLLHRSVFRLKGERRVRAINRNLLDARRTNLQTCTRSDIAILNRSAPVRKIVGVHYSVPPKWLLTDCFWHAAISVRGEKVHVGSFRTPDEAAAAFDAAAVKVHGAGTTTNQRSDCCRPRLRARRSVGRRHGWRTTRSRSTG